MEWDDLAWLLWPLLAVGNVIYNIVKKMAARDEEARPESDRRAEPSPEDALALRSDLEARVRESQTQLEGSRARFAKISGPVQVLLEALDRIEEQITAAGRRVADDVNLQLALQEVELIELRLMVADQLAEWRLDPETAANMVDADALADALIEPVAQLARTEIFDFPPRQPICVPADPEREMVWFGLLPPRYPVVFVPQDFGKDLLRWPAMAHEMGHVIWRNVPGFDREVRKKLGLGRQSPLPYADSAGNLTFSFEHPFSAWIEEIVCDVFTALMLGPAALRGLVYAFADPEDPEEVLWAGATQTGAFEPHPPQHLRILICADVLERFGFREEIKPIVAEWQATHGNPERIFLPGTPNAIAVPVESFMDAAHTLLDGLLNEAYTSLTGRELRSIHGLHLTPGMWAKVQRRAEDLRRDVPFNDDPRVVIAAAIEARAAGCTNHGMLARGVRRAIIGRNSGEKRVSKNAYAISKGTRGRGLTKDDVRQALILRDVIQRRPRTR